jgi:AraC-like DNA-binding protein
MKTQFETYQLSRLVEVLHAKLGGETEKGCKEERLAFGDGPSLGKLNAFDFEDGLQALLFDGKLAVPFVMQFSSVKPSPMLMFFHIRGGVGLHYGDSGSDALLRPLETVFLAYPPGGAGSTITLYPKAPITFLMLVVEREVYADHIKCFPKKIVKALSAIFAGQPVAKNLAVGHEPAAKTALLMQEVLSLEQNDGFARATTIESKILEVLGVQLRCWEEDITVASGEKMLHPDDIEKLNEALRLLLQDLKSAPTIEELALLAGINRQKLKQGFKKMFGVTINERLSHERMRAAKQLFAEGESNVRNVAASVGYEHPSYFARRFKERFGLYPNEYIRSLQNTAEANRKEG